MSNSYISSVAVRPYLCTLVDVVLLSPMRLHPLSLMKPSTTAKKKYILTQTEQPTIPSRLNSSGIRWAIDNANRIICFRALRFKAVASDSALFVLTARTHSNFHTELAVRRLSSYSMSKVRNVITTSTDRKDLTTETGGAIVRH